MSKALDKFYTKAETVRRLIRMIHLEDYDIIIEPSAGDGAFCRQLPAQKTIAMDISPDTPPIIKQDFFDFDICGAALNKKILTIGNPPFGKNSSLAVKFFNHAATYSDTIAFVLPRTFRKNSISNRLDLNFHMTDEYILPKDSFYLPSGEDYGVPTVIQIWKREATPRKKIKLLASHPDFIFLGSEDFQYSTVDLKFVTSPSYLGENNAYAYGVTTLEYESIKNLKKKFPKLFSNHRVVSAKKDIVWSTVPDFAFRRAGSRAGEIFTDYASCPLEGFEFIKVLHPGVIDNFREMWKDTWDPVNLNRNAEKWDTAGQPSISRHELITSYIQKKASELKIL